MTQRPIKQTTAWLKRHGFTNGSWRFKSRQYFPTEHAAEDWLYDHGFAPITYPYPQAPGWGWSDGVAIADLRFNSIGYFIIQCKA